MHKHLPLCLPALALSVLALLPLAARAAPADETVYVDTDTAVVQNYTGNGVQWDPSDVADYTDAQWARIFRRVDVLKPQFIRCCLVPNFYCAGFDSQGQPIYTWDSAVMGRLYKILDYCQSRHVEVMLGEWGPSFGLAADDPRWSRLIGDCLEHLVRAKGYTCIRYYNKQNEPRGGQDVFEQWRTSQVGFASELSRRGLDSQVKQVGPDVSGQDIYWWVDAAATELPVAMKVYEVHFYASDDEITGGAIEKVLRQKRAYVTAHDPSGQAKPFLVAEAGTSDTLAALTGDWNSGDSNTKIRDFSYGVMMSDYLLQTMRAGIGGVSAWDLDDSMHPQAKIAPTPANPHAYNLKVWGFWNTLGGVMGKPEDENLRPWFYPWSLLCRSFPRGMKVVRVSSTSLPGVRVAAATLPHGGKSDLSLAVVNDSDVPHTLRLVLPNALGRAALKEYHYFDSDRPTDAEGFPAARRILPASLRDGLNVTLPSRGLVLLTTLGGGSPVALTTGVKVPVSAVTVHDAQILRGETVPMKAVTVPDNGVLRWSVSAADGKPTALATITSAGLLTAKGLGRVRVTATAMSGVKRDIQASALVSITRDKLIVDNMQDWNKTDTHSNGWAFETIHPDLFEGAPSHLKRVSDTPESLVYHLDRLTDFEAKVYFTGALSTKVRFYTSSDGGQWTPLAVQNEAPVPTGWTFLRTRFRPVELPPGTNYLKIEFASDASVFSPQLGQVRLISSPDGHSASAPVLPVSEATILARSVLNVGDTARLRRVFARARRGEPVTIAVIGGSITAGAAASTVEGRYGNRVAAWWRERFPQARIEFVNAGIGATGSNYGALRAGRDLLNRHPDFVVVDYGVNDGNERSFAETFEGLVRQVLSQPQEPALVPLYFMHQGGGNAQEWLGKIGAHYALPQISYRDALWPEILAGRLKQEDIFHDEVHPNDRGHEYAARFVTHYLESVLRDSPAVEVSPEIKPLPAPLLTDAFQHVHLYDGASLAPTHNQGWTLDASSQFWHADIPGSVLEADVNGTQVLALGFRFKGPMGRARVQVDNQPPVTLEGWFDATWGGYLTVDVAARNLNPGMHHVRVELLPDKAEGSTGHEFRLYGLGTAGAVSP